MANPEHREILETGKATWQQWRENYPDVDPDLRGVNLRGQNLSLMNFRRTDFTGAQLWEVDLGSADLAGAKLIGAALYKADLTGANLVKADLTSAQLGQANLSLAWLYRACLTKANLTGANLRHANLRRANLCQADLYQSDLRQADLRVANLSKARLLNANLVEAKFQRAALVDCLIYGVSAWGVQLEGARQLNLVITPQDEPTISVDNLEVAQFIYLLLHNDKIRNVIDTIGDKGVLILGRFTNERKAVLDAIRERLRELGFVPMMFDFERPTQRDFTETIKTLAGMSRFIIADITNPKSSPLELQATMPDYMIPFVPIIHEDEEPFAMFQDLKQKYGEWVLDVLKYDSTDNLLRVLDKAVVRPALEMSQKLLLKKAEAIRARHVRDYM